MSNNYDKISTFMCKIKLQKTVYKRSEAYLLGKTVNYHMPIY